MLKPAPAKVPPELEDLAENIGEFIEYWGFKRIHGRIWTHLFLANKPLDAGELIQRLKVSKALVSMSLSELIGYEVVLEAGKSERGTLLYRANDKVIDVILSVLRRREKRMMGRISTACRSARGIAAEDIAAMRMDERKLDFLATMVSEAEKNLDTIISLYQVDFSMWKGLNGGSQ
ncbi:MAG: GbsR/MarR family transcriptional regulator [Pseudobdellovibrionaceae bacterium]